MSRRPIRRRVGFAASVGVLVALAVGAPSVRAAEVRDAGWWWRVQSGQAVAVPPPPGVPEGALLVQGSPDGASAIAAVRYALADVETAPVLSLRLTADSAASAATAVVLACPAATPWRAGTAQPWPEKPEPDCSRQAIGAPSADGTAMVFDLSPFAMAPMVDVVLVPGRVEGLPVGLDGSSFTLVFERPASGDLVTVPAGEPIPAGPGFAPAPVPASQPVAAGVLSAPAFSPRPVTPSFVPPPLPVTPALPPAEVAALGATRAPTATVPAFVPLSDDGRGGVGLALALLVATTVGAVVLARRDQLLSAVGLAARVPDAKIAGLGRFAREREGPPPTLL